MNNYWAEGALAIALLSGVITADLRSKVKKDPASREDRSRLLYAAITTVAFAIAAIIAWLK